MTKIDLAEIETLAQDLQISSDCCVKLGEPLDECTRGQEYGCLLRANTVKLIATALEALPKLVEALRVTQQKMDDCDGNNFAGLFRTDYYECLLSEALDPFTTKTVEP